MSFFTIIISTRNMITIRMIMIHDHNGDNDNATENGSENNAKTEDCESLLIIRVRRISSFIVIRFIFNIRLSIYTIQILKIILIIIIIRFIIRILIIAI